MRFLRTAFEDPIARASVNAKTKVKKIKLVRIWINFLCEYERFRQD